MNYRVTFHMRDGATPEMEFQLAGDANSFALWLETQLGQNSLFFSGPGLYSLNQVSIRCDQVTWFEIDEL